MSASHGGKGDSPRPVDPQKFRENYDRIFRKSIKDHPFKRLGFTPEKAIEYLEKTKPNP